MIETGDLAPDFELHDQGGDLFRLSDQQGKRVVLFFYPRDNTPGCTREATEFTAAAHEFAALGTTVVGISPDSPQSHQRFRNKYDIDLTLISDPDHSAMEPYGVWRQKKLYGRSFLGVVRSTFLINEDGDVAAVWRNVRVAGHVDKVLQAVKDLAARKEKETP
jgi:peroxiredoxin Q/BCP